ncbi:protein PF3D7_1417600-like [Diorhabda sublineata]|uniref:protein PF3D7_1417600-like n=1 Tax=Diorhabda sublineata TaxID=1163346 RepID=UPI0024E0D89F|nr:protein PF3D7_1417600-like [Diorhabda sublineata]
MDTETGEMIVKRVSVPLGLEELMEGLVKEVLLKKPDDIYLFAARYFTHLLSIRDKSQIPHCKTRTLRSVQTLIEKPEKFSSIKASRLSKQFSVRDDASDTPIITQKPKMYSRNELKYKRRHTGPPAILEIAQKDDIRKKYARSVSTEKYKPILESKNRNSKEKSNDSNQKISNSYKTSYTGSKLSVPTKKRDKEIVDTAMKNSKPLHKGGIKIDQEKIPTNLKAERNEEKLNESSSSTGAEVKSLPPDDKTSRESNELLSGQNHDLTKTDHQTPTLSKDNKEVSKIDNGKTKKPNVEDKQHKNPQQSELKSIKTLTDDEISRILLTSISNDGTNAHKNEDKKDSSTKEMKTSELKNDNASENETTSVVFDSSTKETQNVNKNISLETTDKIQQQKPKVDVISDDSLELNEDLEDDVLDEEIKEFDSTNMFTNKEKLDETKSNPPETGKVSMEIFEEKRKENNAAEMTKHKSVDGLIHAELNTFEIENEHIEQNDHEYDKKISRSNDRDYNNTVKILNITSNKIDSTNSSNEITTESLKKADTTESSYTNKDKDGIIEKVDTKNIGITESYSKKEDGQKLNNNLSIAGDGKSESEITDNVNNTGIKDEEYKSESATLRKVESSGETTFKNFDEAVANAKIMSENTGEYKNGSTQLNDSIDKKLDSNILSEGSDGMRTGVEITSIETDNSTNFNQLSEHENETESEAKNEKLVSLLTTGDSTKSENNGNRMLETSSHNKGDNEIVDENMRNSYDLNHTISKNNNVDLSGARNENNKPENISEDMDYSSKNGTYTINVLKTTHSDDAQNTLSDCNGLFTDEHSSSGNTSAREEDLGIHGEMNEELKTTKTTENGENVAAEKREIVKGDTIFPEVNSKNIENTEDNIKTPKNVINTETEKHKTQDVKNGIEQETPNSNINYSGEYKNRKTENIIVRTMENSEKIIDSEAEKTGKIEDAFHEKNISNDFAREYSSNEGHETTNDNDEHGKVQDMESANKLIQQTNVLEKDDSSSDLKSLKSNSEDVHIFSVGNDNTKTDSPLGTNSENLEETDMVDRVAKNYVNYIIDNDRIMQLHTNSSGEDIDNHISTTNKSQGDNGGKSDIMSEDKNGVLTKTSAKDSSCNENDNKTQNKSLVGDNNNQMDSNFIEVQNEQHADSNKRETDEIITKSEVCGLTTSTAMNHHIKYNDDFQNKQYDKSDQNKELLKLNQNPGKNQIQSELNDNEINNNETRQGTSFNPSTASMEDDNEKLIEKDADASEHTKKKFPNKDLIEATLSISENGLIVNKVKHFLNDFIKSEQQHVYKIKPTDDPETKRRSEELIENRSVPGKISSSKLREELKKVEEESQFTNFNSTFNPILLHKEIEEIYKNKVSNGKISIGQVDYQLVKYDLEPDKLEKTVNSVLKIQSMWRAFMVRKALKKVSPEPGNIIKTLMNGTGSVNINKTENIRDSNVIEENKYAYSSFTNFEKLVEAVLRIQATWRGYNVRKSIKHIDRREIGVTGSGIKNDNEPEQRAKDSKCNETISYNSPNIGKQLADSDLDNTELKRIAVAVVRIQAMWKGYKVRNHKKKNTTNNDLRKETRNDEDTNILLETHVVVEGESKDNKDAATSENSWSKKREVPKNPDILSEVYAAIIIQKLWRGFRIRKTLLNKNNDKSSSPTEESARKKTPIESPPENIAVHMQGKLESIQETKFEDKEDVIKVDKKSESQRINLNNKGRETYFSKDSTDSQSTVIHNESQDSTKISLPRFHSESMDPLLNEISNYPITKEENLLDDYQNKLLNKISGKEEENYDDLKRLEKIITPRAIDDLNLESFKTSDSAFGSVLPKVDKIESRDKKLTRSLGSKLEILEEEEGSNVEEDKNEMDHISEKTRVNDKMQNTENSEKIKIENIDTLNESKNDKTNFIDDKKSSSLDEIKNNTLNDNGHVDNKKGEDKPKNTLEVDIKLKNKSESNLPNEGMEYETKDYPEVKIETESNEIDKNGLKNNCVDQKEVDNYSELKKEIGHNSDTRSESNINAGTKDSEEMVDSNNEFNNTIVSNGCDTKLLEYEHEVREIEGHEFVTKENMSIDNLPNKGVEHKLKEISKLNIETKQTNAAINSGLNEAHFENNELRNNCEVKKEIDDYSKLKKEISIQSESRSETNANGKSNDSEQKVDNNMNINNNIGSNDSGSKLLEYEHGMRETEENQFSANNSLTHITSTNGSTDKRHPDIENVGNNNGKTTNCAPSTSNNFQKVEKDPIDQNKISISIPIEKKLEEDRGMNGSLYKDIGSEGKLLELKSDPKIEAEKHMNSLELHNSMGVKNETDNAENTSVSSSNLENNGKMEIGRNSTESDIKLEEKKDSSDNVVDAIKSSVDADNSTDGKITPFPVLQNDQQDSSSLHKEKGRDLYTFCSIPTPFSTNDKVGEYSPPIDVEHPLSSSNKYKANEMKQSEVLKNGTLVIPLPIEVQKTLKEQKKENSVDGEVKKSASLEGLSSLLSNTSMHSGKHDTVMVPMDQHESIDIGRSQPISVKLCQTSGQVYLIIILSLTSDINADAENMTSQRPPSTLNVTDVSTDAAVEQKNAQKLGKGDLQQPKAENGYSADNSISQRETMESEKRRKIDRGKNMEAEAATKIQAGFRGYQVRKQLKLKNGSSDMNTRKSSMKSKSSGSDTSKSQSSDLEQQSAVKIQAGVRGFLVRRRQKKQSNQA